MDNYRRELKNIPRTRQFFIGVDSDGCVFDSMGLKHKECFCPAFINNFDLQPAAGYARETWEFVNLYSKSRGCNRFIALVKAIALLKDRTEVLQRISELPDLSELENWIEQETKLGQNALADYIKQHSSSVLKQALAWSMDVTAAVEKIVHGLPPIPGVKESLEVMSEQADIMVVSQTPLRDLQREWAEHHIDRYCCFIAGQEYGTKAEHLQFAAVDKYDLDNILMIGDAPGDLKSAKANNVMFYPIIAGQEVESWQRLYDDALPKFFSGTFRGEYEQSLLWEFENNLPEFPDWQKK